MWANTARRTNRAQVGRSVSGRRLMLLPFNLRDPNRTHLDLNICLYHQRSVTYEVHQPGVISSPGLPTLNRALIRLFTRPPDFRVRLQKVSFPSDVELICPDLRVLVELPALPVNLNIRLLPISQTNMHPEIVAGKVADDPPNLKGLPDSVGCGHDASSDPATVALHSLSSDGHPVSGIAAIIVPQGGSIVFVDHQNIDIPVVVNVTECRSPAN